MVQSVADSVLAREIAWAANEATAMAWFTACPILVLPALLEEKVFEAMRKWHKREQMLHRPAKR
ncbi:MAG: hypothetical protein NTW03_04860, partial [Verrucomicrobia bacterium]|nr:hypothetical protein [Verrucomicrobiota bacterium]